MVSPALRTNLQAQALLANSNSNASLLDRLEKLEQHLLEQTSQQVNNAIDDTLPWVMLEDDEKKSQSSASLSKSSSNTSLPKPSSKKDISSKSSSASTTTTTTTSATNNPPPMTPLSKTKEGISVLQY